MILRELRHLICVLLGRVRVRPGRCDRCPAIITQLTSLKAETYGLVGEVTCPRCEKGIVRPVPHPADGHIARAAAHYGDGGQP